MKSDKNFIGIVALLVIAGGLSAGLYFRQMREDDAIRMPDFPMQVGEWKGEDIPLDDRTYKVLETKNLIMRRYVNPKGEDVYLYIVASEKNRKVSHPPEVCYMGSGAKIVEKNQVKFSVSGLNEELTVNSFVSIEKGESLVYYWYKSGDKFTADYLSQQAKAALSQLAGKTTTIALIKVSTPIVNGDKEKANQILQKFSAEIIPFVKK